MTTLSDVEEPASNSVTCSPARPRWLERLDLIESMTPRRQQIYFSKFQERVAKAGGAVCNICGGRAFSDFGIRTAARCIDCKSRERARVMALHLAHFHRLRSGLSILHIAPETALRRLINDSAPRKYQLADINTERFEKRGLSVTPVDLCGDLSRLTGPFDIILHSHVLEHVKCNYVAVIMRLNALLAPHGRHIFQIPISPGEFAADFAPPVTGEVVARRRLFGQNGHMRRFGRADLGSTLGMLFDVSPYLTYDLTAIANRKTLRRANIPDLYWRGPTAVTVFDIRKEDFYFREPVSPSRRPPRPFHRLKAALVALLVERRHPVDRRLP